MTSQTKTGNIPYQTTQKTFLNLLDEIHNLLEHASQGISSDKALSDHLSEITPYIKAIAAEIKRDPSIIDTDTLMSTIALHEARQLKTALETLKSPLSMLSITHVDRGHTSSEYLEKYTTSLLKTLLQLLQDSDKRKINTSYSANINQLNNELHEIKATFIPEKISDAIKASNNDNIVQLEIIEKNRTEVIEQQVAAHQKAAQRWIICAFFVAILTISLGIILYFRHTTSPSIFVQTREVLINIFLMGFLTTLTFISFRQYSINKHNQLQWLHKKYATSTFLRLARESALDAETRKSIIIKTLDAVFHLPDFGYLKPDKTPDLSELFSLVKSINNKSE